MGLFEACLVAAVDELRQAVGEVPLSQVPEATAGQAGGFSPEGRPNHVLLLLPRSSGDERADRIRLGVPRSLCERMAAIDDRSGTPGLG
ncbi:hypothetical protein [Rugosimonospora acidiphila]|uniref:hypothetical protein n=1 Tax=Rugosimonospora acidiphila TaxID=556531 RepID=UPI0031ED6BDC